MLRYIVLILLIVLAILAIINLILNKILKVFSLFEPPKKKTESEILYKDDEVIVLKGESKKDNGSNEKQH